MSASSVGVSEAAHVPGAVRSAYPLRTGNFVRPLVDGEPAFRRICEAVEAGRHSVWVTVAFLEHAVQMPAGRGTFLKSGGMPPPNRFRC